MKYRVLNRGYDFIKEDELLNTLLKNRGVENPHELLHLGEQVLYDGNLLSSMNEGLELLHKHIVSKNDICFVVDSDTDGYTSAAKMYKYIKDIDNEINIKYILHNGKEHGIQLDELKDYNFDLLIVPDAATNDVQQCKILKNKGKDILILDHHIITEGNPYATVINCQDGKYPNSTLSGVGVVYKFCKEYDKKYNYNFADNYLDLVALGMIADDMDLRNYETRYITIEGIKRMGKDNEFLKEIIEKQQFQLKDNINITGVGWYIAPLFNAVVRAGTMEEKIDMFKALIGVQELREYKPRKTKKNPIPPIEHESLQKNMARQCINIKSRQDRLVKKGVEKINNKIHNYGLEKNKILMIDVTEDIDKTFTGLVANKISEQYKRPTLLLRNKCKNVYGGSGRNYRLSSIENLREFLLNLHTFNSINGHINAFGIDINKEKIDLTQDLINQALKDNEIEDVHLVDYEIPIGRLKEQHIKQVGQWCDIWGNKISEPLFAITDIYISTEDVRLLGEKKNIIKFDKKIGGNTITFIKFFANEGVYNKMIMKQTRGLKNKMVKRVKMDIVGKFKINKWNNTDFPQIEIVDFNVVESKKFIF